MSTPPTIVEQYTNINNQVIWTLYSDGTISPSTGGTPSAPANSIQFNNAGAFGGSTEFTFSNHILSLNTTASIDINGTGQIPSPSFGDGSNAMLAISALNDTPYTIMFHQQTRAPGEFGYIWQNGSGHLDIAASDSVLYHIIRFDVVNHQISISPNGSNRNIALNAPVGIQAIDTTLTRFSAGVLAIGNGVQGDTSGKAAMAHIKITGLSVFANNAAAITGGLAAGDFYRTGADPDVVCVVH